MKNTFFLGFFLGFGAAGGSGRFAQGLNHPRFILGRARPRTGLFRGVEFDNAVPNQ